jgi:hypothetical protein
MHLRLLEVKNLPPIAVVGAEGPESLKGSRFPYKSTSDSHAMPSCQFFLGFFILVTVQTCVFNVQK